MQSMTSNVKFLKQIYGYICDDCFPDVMLSVEVQPEAKLHSGSTPSGLTPSFLSSIITFGVESF